MKTARLFLGLCLVLVTLSASAEQREFPLGPDPRLTPGSYCRNPDTYRYPEKIPYCNRDVDRDEKMQVIEDYNRKLGYRIERRDRPQYKIDHLIPLCAGGSNETDNLWPQHQSVYRHTDAIEGLACEKMSAGKLTQKRAVELIFRAKLHLEEAPEVERALRSL